MATRRLLGEFIPVCEQAARVTVSLVSVGGVEAARRLRAGERFDVAVLAADALEGLAGDGCVDPASLVVVACSASALAVRSGARRPGGTDEPSLKTWLATQKTVGISTGPSGRAVRALFQRWGLGEPVLSIIEAPAGVPVARLIASGECDAGFQQLSELAGEPGIDIVGTLPDTLVPTTRFSAGVCRTAENPTAGRALLSVLTSALAAPIILRHAMQPPA